MQIRIHSMAFSVLIAGEPITIGGKLKAGIADWDNQRIFIGPQVPPGRRLSVLLHEVWHSWRVHSPRATKIEEECNQFSVVAETIIRDLEAHGGSKALELLKAA